MLGGGKFNGRAIHGNGEVCELWKKPSKVSAFFFAFFKAERKERGPAQRGQGGVRPVPLTLYRALKAPNRVWPMTELPI